MSFSYAQVANRSYRPGTVPATPAMSRSTSYASVVKLRNITNTTPHAVVVPPTASPMVASQVSQARGMATGSAPVTVVQSLASNAQNVHVAMNDDASYAKNAPVVTKVKAPNALDAADVTSSTRTARPKRKAAVDAPKTWESEKKKTRRSKKARVDAPSETNVCADTADAPNGNVVDAHPYFATPPPASLTPTNVFVGVRQPAPREMGKFRSYEVVWSDAPSSTASDAAGGTPEEPASGTTGAQEEDYIKLRREMKLRKKAEQNYEVSAPSTAPAATPSNAAASSSATPAISHVKKPPKRRRSKGDDVHRLTMIKKGKGKKIYRSPSPERAPAHKGKGKESALLPPSDAGKNKRKSRSSTHDETDEESLGGSHSGEDASEESDGDESDPGAGKEYVTYGNTAAVIGGAQSCTEGSEAPRASASRPGRAAKRFQKETVTVVHSADESEEGSSPIAPQNGAGFPNAALYPLSDVQQPAGTFTAFPQEFPQLHDIYVPLPNEAQLPAPLPPVPDPFPPLAGPAEPLAAFPAFNDAFPPLSRTAQPPPQPNNGPMAPPDADLESIEIKNPLHPKKADQPELVQETLRGMWKKAGGAILKSNLLMSNADRTRVVATLGIQSALALGLPRMAQQLQDTQSLQFGGFYRLGMERMSSIRGNMKATIKPAIALYGVPVGVDTEPVVEYLFSERRYIYQNIEMLHWETAYMNPAMVTALRCVLYDTMKPAELPIAEYDPGMFEPPDHAYGFEKEIPASVVASVATLIYYALDCQVRDPHGKNAPDITENKYRKEYGYHFRSMENLQKMPKIRHECLSWLYNAVQSQLQTEDGDALTWG